MRLSRHSHKALGSLSNTQTCLHPNRLIRTLLLLLVTIMMSRRTWTDLRSVQRHACTLSHHGRNHEPIKHHCQPRLPPVELSTASRPTSVSVPPTMTTRPGSKTPIAILYTCSVGRLQATIITFLPPIFIDARLERWYHGKFFHRWIVFLPVRFDFIIILE